MTLSMSRVIRSSVGSPSVVDGRRLRRGPLHERSAASAARGARVLQAVGVAFVAVDRRGGRIELEDRLPEPVGEIVDRRRSGRESVTSESPAGARPSSRAVVPSVARSLAPVGAGVPDQLSNRGICSPLRSMAGSRPRYGSRSSRSSGSRAEERPQVVRLDDVPGRRHRGRPAAAASARACSGPARCAPGAMTRNRTSASSGGIRAWRRRSGSPSIAVHSTSNRNATLPRTYQMQSTSASVLGRRADAARGRRALAGRRAGRRAAPSRCRRVCSRRPIQTRIPSRWPASAIAASSSVCSWLRPQQVVGGDEPVGRAGEAAVAVEAGPDERLVGQVVAGEQRRDPVEERGLGRAGRRSTAG